MRATLNELLEKAKLKESTFYIVLAIIIGICAGISFLVFHWMINIMSTYLIGEDTGNAVEGFKRLPLYLKFLLPLSGVFLSGFIIKYISKESGGAGIGLLLKVIKVKNGILPSKMIVFKIITSALSIATGVPLGSEGPIIMIGSAVGSSIGKLFRITISKVKLLVGCGAAAGLAVAFNAPIAGTILAVETILGNFAIGTLTPIVVAAATASFFGAYFLPGHEVIPSEALGFSAQVSTGTEIVLFVVFGLVNALLGVGLIKLTYFNSNIFDKIKQKIPEYFHIPLIILPFALVVPFVPELYGLGRDIMVAGDGFTPEFLIALAVLKLLFLSFAFSSGASGGIFFPILFVGYIFGLGFGKLVPIIFPELGVDMGISFASVGIGALLGAATQEPISSLIIVFEITKDYNILPALMLSTVVSVLLSKKMSAFSIYNYQLVKEGISLEENEEVTLMSENHVELCYVKDCVTARPQDKIIDIVDKMRELERFECYVVDENGKYMGALNGILTSPREVNYNLINPITIARDLIDTSFPVVFKDTPLSDAVKKMTHRRVIEMPVIDSEGYLVGCIHEHDIIEFYNREILSKSSMLKTVHRSEGKDHQAIEYLDNYILESVPSTPGMWGKTLLDLKFRERFNVLILAVKERDSKKSAISPTRKFKPGDILIAAATKDDMERFVKDLGKGVVSDG